MGLETLSWPVELVRGGAGAVAFVFLFLLARWRWRGRDVNDAQTDVGLD